MRGDRLLAGNLCAVAALSLGRNRRPIRRHAAQ
jgi:hypothetical protein